MYLWGGAYMIKNDEIIGQDISRSLPKNVRQIGEVQNGQRIYMEDYAYTYLHQFAAYNKKEEQISFLIGEQTVLDNESILLIHGVIQATHLNRENGNVEMTGETWAKAHEIRKQYFSEYEIIGWSYTQPGYGVLLTSFLIKQHGVFFNQEGKVLLILDPVEKEEAFFQLREGDLIQKTGFFIYYEKNIAMHEYMLEYKVVQENIFETQVDEAVKQYRLKDQEKKEVQYHKRFVNMLFALSGALVIMCILIGIGLLNNLEEMNRLKKSFGAVMEDYGVLKDGLSEEVRGETSVDREKEVTMDLEAANKIPEGTVAENISDSPVTDANSNTEKDLVPEKEEEVQEAVAIVENAEIKSKIPETYIVKPGDNLITISYQFYSTKEMVAEIQEINDIDNPHKIYVGQKLSLPQ
ncbi:MAG: hypothetical protein CVU84_16785 [Firmicutes bacterium HGW-Firmicutes-1]|jgi:LysM repeat protein|nr:MAG: hypothetical protein CVU84_16785 [Firmicutes bacterium HGW-Firmicutes-1]